MVFETCSKTVVGYGSVQHEQGGFQSIPMFNKICGRFLDQARQFSGTDQVLRTAIVYGITLR
jgi:hypothetical protein